MEQPWFSSLVNSAVILDIVCVTVELILHEIEKTIPAHGVRKNDENFKELDHYLHELHVWVPSTSFACLAFFVAEVWIHFVAGDMWKKIPFFCGHEKKHDANHAHHKAPALADDAQHKAPALADAHHALFSRPNLFHKFLPCRQEIHARNFNIFDVYIKYVFLSFFLEKKHFVECCSGSC